MNRVTRIPDQVAVRHALISTFDKTGLADLLDGLVACAPDITIYSTGGTYDFIKRRLAEWPSARLVAITDYTGRPEMQGGLVKTLDFRVFMGLLAECGNQEHQLDLERSAAVQFDLTVVNLYPFDAVIAATPGDLEAARSNIDIGGPSMLRAAAKNFHRVAVLCDPGDYAAFLSELCDNNGRSTLATRAVLAGKAFAHTARYDAGIAAFFAENVNGGDLNTTYVVDGAAR